MITLIIQRKRKTKETQLGYKQEAVKDCVNKTKSEESLIKLTCCKAQRLNGLPDTEGNS